MKRFERGIAMTALLAISLIVVGVGLTAHFAQQAAAVAVSHGQSFVDSAGLRTWFEPGSKGAVKIALARWRESLPAFHARLLNGRWQVHCDAMLPDRPDSPRMTVLAFLRTGKQTRYAGQKLPANSHLFEYRDWARFDLCLAYKRRLRDGVRDYGKTRRAFLGRVSKLELGQWARDHGLPVSVRGIEGLLRRLDPSDRRYDGGVDMRGRYARDGGERVCTPEAWEHFKGLYLTDRGLPKKECYRQTAIEAKRRGWRWPSLSTVRARIGVELPESVASFYRRGAEYWDRHYAPRIQRDYSRISPNEIWVGDHRRCNFWVLHNGKRIRPWVTGWKDRRSRLNVAMFLTPGPDSDSICKAFALAAERYGVPRRVETDNGLDYLSKAFTGGKKQRDAAEKLFSVCGRLSIEVGFCRKRQPQSKHIEREFRSMDETLDRYFETYCGRAVSHRPEKLYEKIKAGTVAIPSFQEAAADLAQWVDAENNRPHTGDAMGGKSPIYVFTHCDPIAKRSAPADQLKLLLLKTVSAKVGKAGVMYRGVWYGQANLVLRRLIGRRVLLRIDSDAADRVDVLNPANGRFITTAVEQRLRGLTQADIKAAARRRKAAMRDVKRARPQYELARKGVVAHAQAARKEYYLDELRKAAGAEGFDIDAAPPARNLELLPGAADVSGPERPVACNEFNRPADESAAEQDDVLLPETDVPAEEDFDAGFAALPDQDDAGGDVGGDEEFIDISCVMGEAVDGDDSGGVDGC